MPKKLHTVLCFIFVFLFFSLSAQSFKQAHIFTFILQDGDFFFHSEADYGSYKWGLSEGELWIQARKSPLYHISVANDVEANIKLEEGYIVIEYQAGRELAELDVRIRRTIKKEEAETQVSLKYLPQKAYSLLSFTENKQNLDLHYNKDVKLYELQIPSISILSQPYKDITCLLEKDCTPIWVETAYKKSLDKAAELLRIQQKTQEMQAAIRMKSDSLIKHIFTDTLFREAFTFTGVSRKMQEQQDLTMDTLCCDTAYFTYQFGGLSSAIRFEVKTEVAKGKARLLSPQIGQRRFTANELAFVSIEQVRQYVSSQYGSAYFRRNEMGEVEVSFSYLPPSAVAPQDLISIPKKLSDPSIGKGKFVYTLAAPGFFDNSPTVYWHFDATTCQLLLKSAR